MRLRRFVPVAIVAFGGTLGWWNSSDLLGEARAQEANAQRETATGAQLPQPDPDFKGKIGETYNQSSPSYPLPVKAPKGSPTSCSSCSTTWASACARRSAVEVGRDSITPVDPAYKDKGNFAFSGKIDEITFALSGK